jgi:O-methyltransferase involved in polyketide biosynthesis
VILGAGYDTFILRQPEWAKALRIYEVDHPSTGSEIAFTFAQPAAPGQEGAMRVIAERAAAMGEPWLTCFEPEALERKLRELGFAQVEFLEPADSAARYFADRADKLPAPTRTTIVSATI